MEVEPRFNTIYQSTAISTSWDAVEDPKSRKDDNTPAGGGTKVWSHPI